MKMLHLLTTPVRVLRNLTSNSAVLLPNRFAECAFTVVSPKMIYRPALGTGSIVEIFI